MISRANVIDILIYEPIHPTVLRDLYVSPSIGTVTLLPHSRHDAS